MRSTKPIHGAEARAALKRGIDQVFNSVAPTLGAKGRNAVYKQYGAPIVTNDGVSIARQVLPEDPGEYLGAEMIKQAGERQNEEAGDGTTTVTVVAHALIEEGLKALEEGENPMVLRKQLDEAKDEALEILKGMSTPVENILDVARISVEDEKLAQLVADVVTKAGPHGSIIVEEGHGFATEVDEVKGYWFERGYVSPYMITNERGEAILENCAVIVTDRYLNLNKDLVTVLNDVIQSGVNSVLVIADNVEGELLQTLIQNKLQGRLTTVAVKRPASVEELEDIATLVRGTAVTKDKGINQIAIQHVGKAKKVIVKRDQTIIVGEEGPELTQRIADLEQEIKDTKEKYGIIEQKKVRLARLTSGLSVVRVGAKTDAERGYLKLKIDDAVGACRAAVEEGIVPGGGTTLLDISWNLTQGTTGAALLTYALRTPYQQILENAGMEEKEGKFNILTGEAVDDMVKAGIVDPTKVARCVIENAVSFAKTFLTIETVLAEVPKEEKPSAQGAR